MTTQPNKKNTVPGLRPETAAGGEQRNKAIISVYESALTWLNRGFFLLPIQPGTKKQAAGFGSHQQQIKTEQEAKRYFYKNLSRFNLAVVAPEGSFILDFDNWDIYLEWLRFVKKFDDKITTSYTEITPNDGAHVFLSGPIPNGIKLIDHVEIKRVVLVAPSIVDGRHYDIMRDAGIYSGSLDACFFSLRKSTDAMPAPVAGYTAQRSFSSAGGSLLKKLDAIKSAYNIPDLMKKYFSKTAMQGRGRYLTACCPFHEEKEPSFWIDVEKNIFGCHACKVKGDVINFFALANHIGNPDAISKMAEAL